MCVGFALTGEADVSGYARCLGYRLETSAAQATVWLADDVQYELASYEFVMWPAEGSRVLAARIVNGQAVWVDAKTSVVNRIGELRGTWAP
ncbi:MAG TPA: hypothetical protein VF477_00745 [Mycobacterium sp.]